MFFPAMAAENLLKPFVAIPETPVITGMILHLMFHFHCTAIRRILYLSFLSASFCVTFLSAPPVISVSVLGSSLIIIIIIISGLFVINSVLLLLLLLFGNRDSSVSVVLTLNTG